MKFVLPLILQAFVSVDIQVKFVNSTRCHPGCLPACQGAAWLGRSSGGAAERGLNLRGRGERVKWSWANKLAWCSSHRMPTAGPMSCISNSSSRSHTDTDLRHRSHLHWCVCMCEWYSQTENQESNACRRQGIWPGLRRITTGKGHLTSMCLRKTNK